MTHGTPTRATIVVGAHFDAVPLAPGADDNGSGVAALLELARAYKALHDAGWTQGSTIRLVFFNLEEVGLVGSAHHVEQWKIKSLGLDRKPDAAEGATAQKPAAPKAPPVRERISLMLSLECLGFFSDEPNSQNSPFKPIPGVFEPPTVADNIVLVTIAKHQGMCKDLEAAMLKAAPALKIFRADFSPLPLPDLMRSDHAPFMLAGVPAFMVTDTANFRNPNYHKPTDTVDTLDLPRLTLVTQAVAGAVWELAQPTAPQHEPRP
jgi:Zn-dependent M28 family amino/carboxypeptidase